MRLPWPKTFPPLFTHMAWNPDNPDVDGLGDHALYSAAKRRRNLRAALRICDDVTKTATLDEIYDACQGPDDKPIVVAPAPSLETTQNALAIGYGRWLANEMGWDVCATIFQLKTVSRDYVKDPWFRLANEPEFYGRIERGRRYVIADDVCTMGGTITSLRGFIESQGGCVTCMTTLASREGSHAQISLARGTLSRLTALYDGRFNEAFRRELGYEPECLTEREGRFLLRCPSLDAFREGLDGARNGTTPRGV